MGAIHQYYQICKCTFLSFDNFLIKNKNVGFFIFTKYVEFSAEQNYYFYAQLIYKIVKYVHMVEFTAIIYFMTLVADKVRPFSIKNLEMQIYVFNSYELYI